jgi:hypothetical protein
MTVAVAAKTLDVTICATTANFQNPNLPTPLTMSSLMSRGVQGQSILRAAIAEIASCKSINPALATKGSVEDGFVNRAKYLREPGFIYVIEEVGRNIFKVGFSKKPDRRLTQLPTKEPFERRLIRIYEVDAMRWSEKWIHNIILDSCDLVTRLNGEWFEGKDLPYVLDHWSPFSLRHVVNEVCWDTACSDHGLAEIRDELWGYDFFGLMNEIEQWQRLGQ